jgi:hypothetical protein
VAGPPRTSATRPMHSQSGVHCRVLMMMTKGPVWPGLEAGRAAIYLHHQKHWSKPFFPFLRMISFCRFFPNCSSKWPSSNDFDFFRATSPPIDPSTTRVIGQLFSFSSNQNEGGASFIEVPGQIMNLANRHEKMEHAASSSSSWANGYFLRNRDFRENGREKVAAGIYCRRPQRGRLAASSSSSSSRSRTNGKMQGA